MLLWPEEKLIETMELLKKFNNHFHSTEYFDNY